MNIQIGDLFRSKKNKTGLIIDINEKSMYSCKILWSCGTTENFTKKEISFWISNKEMDYLPVIK